MIIGIVLNNIPRISETFLISKIKLLQDSGNKVIIFTNKKGKFDYCRVVHQRSIRDNYFVQIGLMSIYLFLLIIKRPRIVKKFINLEKNDGVTFKKRIENLYLNSHILNHNLDWVHFGFATLMIRRENIADAIGAKMGVSFRGYDISIYPLKHKFCYHKVWKKIDKIHSISNDLLSSAYELGLNKNIPSFIIHPAINTSQFISKKKKLNKNQKIRFLSVARLHWKKGIEYTLQSLSILKRRGLLFSYTIVGSGAEYERLIYATYQLGLNEEVVFAGSVPHKAIKEYYEKAEIYLQYSIQEGFCNAVLESQSMGLITLVSDAEGLAENVIDNQTGWVVRKRSPELLAEKIEYILSLPKKKINEIKTNAIIRVQSDFDLKLQEKKFLNFYKN